MLKTKLLKTQIMIEPNCMTKLAEFLSLHSYKAKEFSSSTYGHLMLVKRQLPIDQLSVFKVMVGCWLTVYEVLE